MIPKIDVLVVLHNSRRWLPELFKGLQTLSNPVTVHFLDNDSRDGTPDEVLERIPTIPSRAYLSRSLSNNGFARGVNLLARQCEGEYLFLLNPDAELQHGCIETLLRIAENDPGIGIVEARQMPHQHPKTFDRITHETSWCSGAAALVRRRAFEEAGGFDERLYFMYCEDVDLSWRFWISGWRCIYAPEACIYHRTQELDPQKRRTLENYFTFRNSLFLFYRFGSWKKHRVVSRFLLKRFCSPDYSLKSKVLFGIALADHIRYIPYLLKTRQDWSGSKHSWIRFEETSLSD